MLTEIERKFLLTSACWRTGITQSLRITQGISRVISSAPFACASVAKTPS